MKHNLLSKLLSLAIASLLLTHNANAQAKFGDNKQTVNAGSLLELESSSTPYKGLLLPRIPLTSTGVWGLGGTGVGGMIVYNTNIAITSADTVNYPIIKGGVGLYTFDGTGWKGLSFTASASASVSTGPKILSKGRVPGVNDYFVSIADSKVTATCTIVATVEEPSGSYAPILSIDTRTPGVGFRVFGSWLGQISTSHYINYIIIE